MRSLAPNRQLTPAPVDLPVDAGRHRRRHGSGIPHDREQLEEAGWRTTLDYTETLRRSRDGRLRQLQVEWRATAERLDHGATIVVSARSSSPDKVWSRLRIEADHAVIAWRREMARAG